MITTFHHRPRTTATAALLLLGGCCDSLFYRPGDEPVPAADELEMAAQDLAFAAPDGPQLHGWWLPAAGESRGTVVYCHGNTGNIARHVGWVRWLPAHGFNVVVFDYRGYGRSAGTTSRPGTVADAVAAIDLALARDPQRTVVYGHSLGGAIAVNAVAARPEVRAIVVEGTFPSYREIARARIPLLGWLLQFLVSDGDDPEDVLDRIPPRPLLVCHGTEDSIVPFWVGEALFERAREPKTFHAADGCGHRTAWVHEGGSFERMLVDFFATAIRAGTDDGRAGQSP
ncbi:MAG: alpha/beta fold hydrolase [Planctomycetes bacterium]|nr:alpha/beta fold hydrolase [Planctomycetota bacterium]